MRERKEAPQVRLPPSIMTAPALPHRCFFFSFFFLQPHISTHVITFAFTLPANCGARFSTTLISSDVFSACVGIGSINGGVIYNSRTVWSKGDRSGSSLRRDAGKYKTFAVTNKCHDWQPRKLLSHTVKDSLCNI